MALGHSLFQSVLLSWSTSTGQMNNHCALKCHIDGNQNCEVETITIFERTNVSSPRSRRYTQLP
jgi:hypothetical protein